MQFQLLSNTKFFSEVLVVKNLLVKFQQLKFCIEFFKKHLMKADLLPTCTENIIKGEASISLALFPYDV